MPVASPTMQLTSSAFQHNESIPATYTCDGIGVNPPLTISDVPEGAQSLVLIVDDPDIPQTVKDALHIDVYDHWILFNLPPTITEISEGSTPQAAQGVNSNGQNNYIGCCPPDAEHRYFFKLYALNTTLDLPEGSTKREVEQAMEGNILEKTELIGHYNRPQNH